MCLRLIYTQHLFEQAHHISVGSSIYIPLGIILTEGNAGFQPVPALRLTPKDQSTSQLHTLAVPTSSKQEVIYRKLCKAQIAEEILYMTIMQSKQKLWSDIPLHYSVVLRWYFSSNYFQSVTQFEHCKSNINFEIGPTAQISERFQYTND